LTEDYKLAYLVHQLASSVRKRDEHNLKGGMIEKGSNQSALAINIRPFVSVCICMLLVIEFAAVTVSKSQELNTIQQSYLLNGYRQSLS
jgi:hypothetical protein